MSNYTPVITNYAAKDLLTAGDTNKKIRGAQLDAELSAIATMSTTKEDLSNKGIANGYLGLDASLGVTVSGALISTSSPVLSWLATAPADTGRYRMYVATATGAFSFETINDAQSAVKNILSVARTANVVTNLTFGNATDNPTVSFAGTGTIIAHAANTGARLVVGVPTTGQHALDVVNTSSGSGSSMFTSWTNSTDADCNLRVSQVGAGTKFASFGPDTNIPLTLRTANTDRVTVGNAGQVTIAQPTGSVEALTVTAVAGKAAILATASPSGTSAGITVQAAAGRDAVVHTLGNNASYGVSDVYFGQSGSGAGIIYTSGASLLSIGTNSVERLNISSDGTAITVNGETLNFWRRAKTADESRSSTVTPAVDSSLAAALTAGTYIFDMFVLLHTSAGGILLQCQYSGSQTGGSVTANGNVAAAPYTTSGTAFGSNFLSVNTTNATSKGNYLRVTGTFVASTSGTFALWWCQNSSNAGASIVDANSWMIVSKV